MGTVYDAIVVGMGAVGTAAAYHLGRQGQRVLALDQFELDHRLGSSYGESRIIRYAYDHPLYVQMANDAFAEWRQLEAACGRPLMVRTGGLDFGATDSPALNAVEHNLATAHVRYERLTPVEVASRFPQFRLEEHMHAIYQPDAAALFASRCVIALAEIAHAGGAVVMTRTPVIDIEVRASSAVVHTYVGNYEARTVILAAGAWLGSMLHRLDLDLPLYATREQIVFFKADEQYRLANCPVFIDYDRPYHYGLPDVDGSGVKIGIHGNNEKTDPDRTNRTADSEYIEAMRTWKKRYLPGLGDEVTEARVCLYTMTPDEHFIIDRHPAYPHVIFASACSGHGFKFSILTGRILADLALGRQPAYDLSLFRVARFLGGQTQQQETSTYR